MNNHPSPSSPLGGIVVVGKKKYEEKACRGIKILLVLRTNAEVNTRYR
jgi:hypothetical protein